MTLAELRALCERAIDDPTRDDYEHALVAAARTWLPALIEVAEAAQHLLYGPGITDIGCDGVCYSLVQIDTMLWIECVGCGKKKMLNSNDLHSHTVDCLVLRAEAALARLDETGRP